MIKAMILSAAMLGLTAAQSVASPPRELCKTVSDDAAYIMGVRQRGEPMTSILDNINWMKYRRLDSDLHIQMTSLAWDYPIQRSSRGRQLAVQEFAENMYNFCMSIR